MKITQQKEIEFALELFGHLRDLINLVLAKYNAVLSDLEEEENPFEEMDDPLEDEILF